MTVTGFPFETKQLSAANHGAMLAGLSSRGVLKGYLNDLAVSASSPAAMSVEVATGAAFVGSAVTWAYVRNDATKVLTIAAADPTNPRWDLIVAERDNNSGVRAVDIKVVQGTPAGSPADPSLTQDETKYQMVLARVVVGAAVTTIVAGNITDLRAYATTRFAEDEAFAYKSADETVNNSTTLQNDDNLVLPLAINSYYAVLALLVINSAATPDFKFLFTVPASAVLDGGFHQLLGGTSWSTFSEAAAVAVEGGGGTDTVVLIMARVYTAGTAGNLQLQWAQNTGDASDTKVLKGSWLRVKKLS